MGRPHELIAVELESHVDAWYVWVGALIASIAIAGVAVSLPSEAPPDANQAANTIEEVGTSTYNASAEYEHDATEVKLDAKTIAMENDGGVDRATIAFGSMTPVREHPNHAQPGLDVLWGEPVSEVFDSPEELEQWAEQARQAADETGGEWRQSNDRLRVKHIRWGDVSVTLVDA